MLRPVRFLTMLTAVLFVFVTTGMAQVCQQQVQQQPVCVQQPVCTQQPVCAQQPVCKEPTPPPVREKPAAVAAPRIERNLPPPYWKEAERANRAARILDEFGEAHFPLGYPGWLANNAKAIAVFPSVKKGAFVFGGRWGKGLFSTRDENGCWLPPSYVNIGGGSFGFQAGFQATDIVLVFTTDNAVRALLTSKLTLNGTAQAAGGPWGRDAQAGIDVLLSSPVLAFSRSRGAFLGVSLDGSVLTIDDSSNQDVYGMYVSGTDILRTRRVEPNDAVAPFMTSLAQVSPGSRQASASTSAPTN